jgi:hypothetical protein
MNTHLTPEDLVAALDGSLDAPQAAHLASCASCRASVADAERMVGRLADDRVPEPPRAFWDELDERVRAETSPLAAPTAGRASMARTWAALGGLAAAAAVALVWSMGPERPVEDAGDAGPADTATVAEGPSWEAMADLAATMSADDVRRVTASTRVEPIAELSDEERRAFVELLAREMGEPQ